MTIAAKKYWSDKELLAIPKDGFDHEIINGEHYMSPAGANHGMVIGQIFMALGVYVKQHKCGKIFDGQTGCRMKTDDLFSPDISFATNQQWKKHKKSGETFFQGSPIFVIEVLSPGDKIGALDEKIPQYFENGAKLAWVVNPISKTVLVYHGPSADKLYKLGDSLDGENVLPGFALPLTEVFED